MLLIREVFNAKPGKAGELAKKFKQVIPYMEKEGLKNVKVMTDLISNYWTVVIESETEEFARFEKEVRGFTSKPEVKEIMKDYMSLVDGGYREVFKIE
ncbi:MAG: hypothetical protein A2057_07000 [Ignavibacteria bacterium GWA2_35_9]|nr:MAG: hypothetical protein A2057_07000 [Ignavibacteria bacterium GWA2_35_9]OGU53294.1 MAG: hypothetical protein A2080_17025 [Ignavibacteria bacterium GWC2_36_12]